MCLQQELDEVATMINESHSEASYTEMKDELIDLIDKRSVTLRSDINSTLSAVRLFDSCIKTQSNCIVSSQNNIYRYFCQTTPQQFNSIVSVLESFQEGGFTF